MSTTNSSRFVVLLVALSVGSIVMLPARPVFSSDLTNENPIDPNQLKIDVAKSEHSLKNLSVGFSIESQTLDASTLKWEFAARAKGNAWYLGLPRSKIKIQFDSWTSRWVGGTSRLLEKQLTMAFDGTYDLEYDQAEGPPGKLHPVSFGIVTAQRSPLFDEFSRTFTGWGYSLYGAIDWTGRRLSDAIAEPRPPGTKPSSYARVTFQLVPCIEFTLYNTAGGGDIFDLDPSRGFALLGHRHFYKSGIIADQIEVQSLIEAAPNIYFPKEAVLQRRGGQGYSPDTISLRDTFTASFAEANDPNFDPRAFEIKWASGTRIDDQITGSSYSIESSDSDFKRHLEEEVNDSTRAAATAPSNTSGSDAGQ
jgi:hypothetical protein